MGYSVSRISRGLGVCAAALLASISCGFVTQAHATGVVVISSNLFDDTDLDLNTAPANAIKQVIATRYAVQVDNGWVIYQATGMPILPSLKLFNSAPDGSFTLASTVKLKSGGTGLTGAAFNVNGVVFAPCAVAAKTKCAAANGSAGVGLGFGQTTVGTPGRAAAGWVSDSAAFSHLTNSASNTGSIDAVAVDATDGAFAAGWDLNTTSQTNHGVVLTLDSTGQTYAPTRKTDLGTLGGPTSAVLGISKNAEYVVGGADAASGKSHAVYALTGASSWTDMAGGFPADVLKSNALAVSNTGFIAGTATVQRLVSGKLKSVNIGFVYNTSNSTATFFEAPGANVIPLKVLDNGEVVGNLEQLGTGTGTPADHPFLFNGTDLVDFGTMVLSTTGQAAYGCRVNRPNGLGELAGSCIANNTTDYGVSGIAFYLNPLAASPAFVDVNAAIHLTSDVSTPAIKKFVMGTVSSIDDEHQITVIGMRVVGTKAKVAAFLASQVTYNQ
jgi:hypothetical protein